jgi:ATPases of the AAA+ class-like protein
MKENIHEETFLKHCCSLEAASRCGGKLQELAEEFVQEYQDAQILRLTRILAKLGEVENSSVSDLVKTTRLSLIQLCGYKTVIEACQRAASVSENLRATETLQDCLQELNHLIGLQQVKDSVAHLIAYQQVQSKRRTFGLSQPRRTLHLAFTGNPGTGKTTVARIIGRMYRHLDLLSRGHFIEASRTDLIAGYQGQTAQKVKKLIERAKGGVLFIDEAYSITENEHSDSYGRECLTELTKALEDCRQDLVVIVAGYTEPMQQFFESNPGLSSRFNTFIEFADYNEEELQAIFSQMCSQDDYTMSAEADQVLLDILRSVLDKPSSKFANGRFVRNLYENAVMNHSQRVAGIENPTIDELRELEAIDLRSL